MILIMKLLLAVILVSIVAEGHQHHHHHDDDHHHQHHHHHDHEMHDHSHHQHGHDHHDHHNHDHSHHHHDQHDHNHYTHGHQQIEHEQAEPIQPSREKLLDFFQSCQKEVDQWIHIPKSKPIETLLQQCAVFSNADYILQFYSSLANLSSDFTKQHIDLMIKQFKQTRIVPQVLTCITKQREYQNEYLQEKKKYKYLAQFINRYPLQAKGAFPKHHNFKQLGKKTCYFFKALFEYYYLEVLNPSGTLSTEFLRALTVRSKVFEHEDIAFCIAIQSVGKLSGDLEDIDINNVYVKLPQIYNTLRFLKLKEHCRDAHHKKLIANLHNALQGLDMFKIMFKNYEPFVEIATEKMVQTQIRLLARAFSEMIANKEQYLEYSNLIIDDNL